MSSWTDRTAGYFGAFVGLALLCGLFVTMALSVDETSTAAANARRKAEPPSFVTLPADTVESPREDGGASASIHVFECVRDAQRVFSDHSCGANAQVRDIDLTRLNTYEAPAPVPIEEPAISEPERVGPQNPTVVPQPAKRAECEVLQNAKDAIDARMRRGYTSGEGEWLRARRHELEDRYWELRCLKR